MGPGLAADLVSSWQLDSLQRRTLEGVKAAAEALNEGAGAVASAAHFDDCIVRFSERLVLGDPRQDLAMIGNIFRRGNLAHQIQD
jgi:hypothetical protein